MEHYFKKITDDLKRISLRSQATEAGLENKTMDSEERNLLTNQYNQYNYRKYGIRIIPFFAIGGFINIFKTSTRFFIGEILLVTSCTMMVLRMDMYNSDHFWVQSGELVKKYTKYNDLTAVDDQKLDYMKQMYERMKTQDIKKKDFKISNNTKQDQMYEDND